MFVAVATVTQDVFVLIGVPKQKSLYRLCDHTLALAWVWLRKTRATKYRNMSSAEL